MGACMSIRPVEPVSARQVRAGVAGRLGGGQGSGVRGVGARWEADEGPRGARGLVRCGLPPPVLVSFLVEN